MGGGNKESCAGEYMGYVIGGLGTGGTGSGSTPSFNASFIGRNSPQALEFRKNFKFEDYPGPGLDPVARLADMDKDDVEVEVLYASHLRHFYELSAEDEPFFHDIAESYNEWLLEFCSQDSRRLVGLPVISVLNPNGAAADIKAYARRGAKGFMMASSVPLGMSYGDSQFDKIWAAATDCDVPLAMHTTTGRFKHPKFYTPSARAFIGGQSEVQHSIAEMIYGGVFDRFPELKIVSSEFDIGWVAYSVQRIDSLDPRSGLKLSPSEYMRRNVFFTFQNDRVGILTSKYYGEDNFLWASDFPHGVTTWPDSRAIIDIQFKGESEDLKRKIIRDNVAALYKLELDD
jgi:predicted TIM-barrel fold metal-dependent hydrolase